ncbi:MAG: glycosyltransferase family 2 protein, partial [Hyphomonas sp.]|nr:glycosyltransferase family 2 protein [Hyphomonas sp.]
MKVSVVITSHNREAYLAEAIESVFSQTLQPHEVIVVDDGSTDESVAVAHRYGDRVKVIEQANSGCAVARNTGAAAATGTHLAFLDDDDLWP